MQHGSRVVGRSADAAALREGLLRTLGALAADTPPGHLRLSGLPLLRDGGIELAAPEAVDRVAHRGLLARGYTPLYVPSLLVDPATLLARIEAPFGSDEEPVLAPLRRWWTAAPPPDGSAPVSLARVVADVAHRIAPPLHADQMLVDAQGSALTALVQLVEQLPPERGGPGW